MPRPRYSPADVIVVGGGPTGLLVADTLERMGVSATIVEAGPRHSSRIRATDAGDPRWRFQAVGGSARWHRAHAIGGRAHLWGGWSHRFSDHTFKHVDWPYSARTLRPYYERVERWLHVRSNPLSRRYLRVGERLGVRVEAARTSFDSGGLWTGVDVTAGARAVRGLVTALDIEAGHATGIEATTATGTRFTAGAKAIVLAASPIETARLLLASGIRHPLMGKRLTDHFAVSYLLVDPSRGSPRGRPPTAAFIPRFVNTSRRTRRPYPGGFCIELRGNLDSTNIADNLLELVAGRVDPRAASFGVVAAMGEQLPHAGRFVDLAPRAVDAIGRAVPRIHRTRLLPEEQRMLADMRDCCLAIADELAGPKALVLRISDPSIALPIFHPASTCMMGRDDASPCDGWGRYRGLENVWIADASALPTAGDCHPTLTVLAHAMRVCESVRSTLG